MAPGQRKIYGWFLALSAAGTAWIIFQLSQSQPSQTTVVLCPIKLVTGSPCPSCGTTRSVLSILQGDFQDALLLNPLGYLVALGLLIVPVWIVLDLTAKRHSFLMAFRSMERTVRVPFLSVVLISAVLANWIWNIYKGN